MNLSDVHVRVYRRYRDCFFVSGQESVLPLLDSSFVVGNYLLVMISELEWQLNSTKCPFSMYVACIKVHYFDDRVPTDSSFHSLQFKPGSSVIW